MKNKSLPDDVTFYVHSPVKSDKTAAPSGQDSITAVTHTGHIHNNGSHDDSLQKSKAREAIIKRFVEEGMIDNRKASGTVISFDEKVGLTKEVNSWINGLTKKTLIDQSKKEIITTINNFKIPLLLFQNFARSMIYDLSSLKSVQCFLEEFKRKKISLDILYNNAAVMKQRRTTTEDGFEMMFQVNYLAPFILMDSLLESLKAGSSAYIINNGRPSYKVRLNMDDLQFSNNYHMYKSFFVTKLCLLFATFELSRRPKRDGVSVTMIDPGPFKSDLVRDVPMMGWLKNLFSAPVQKAADNILYHIDSHTTQEKNGKVFKEREDWPLSDYWKDTVVSKQLWITTESLLRDTKLMVW